MGQQIPSRNFGLDLVRVTETTALAASRWMGSGNYLEAHRAASQAMVASLNTLQINGRIVVGEQGRQGTPLTLSSGAEVGSGNGPVLDVLVDPIDGTNLVIKGRPDAISVLCVAPRGSIWSPEPAQYMEKIIVDAEAAEALVPECMDAPAAWTLALIARVKRKAVRDMVVIVLERARHEDLIDEIRAAGARILLRDEGDTEGALLAATPQTGVDLLMGTGGASQGVMTACAVKAMGGAMLARIAPQDPEEGAAVRQAGINTDAVMSCDEIVRSNKIFFSATGITHSALLKPTNFYGAYATTHSLLMRAETGTRRFIQAEHSVRL